MIYQKNEEQLNKESPKIPVYTGDPAKESPNLKPKPEEDPNFMF